MSLQILINSILLGGIYALMGIGFSLQWGISGIINLSYGAMVILGAYISLECFNLFQIDPFVSMIISGAILFVIGAIVYRGLLQPLLAGGIIFTLILTFGVRLIVENIILKVWSPNYRNIRPAYIGSTIQVGDTYIPLTKLIVFFIAAVVIYLTYLFMMKTKTGKGIQAVALDKEGAQAVGIDVEKMYLINFAVGTALAGLTGSLWASVYNFSPHLINSITGKVFIVAVLGGLGNIWGAAVGGLFLGIAEAVGLLLFGAEWQEAVGLGIMVGVLIWRPYGLIGQKFFG